MTSGSRPLPTFTFLVVLVAIAVVTNPEASLTAARQGLQLWWTAVLPSLLPFFILTDLLQALGVVKALGFLCEPLMRPVFSLPGAAGFALAVGFTSGFPAGARAAASLTADGLCTPEEGSRLAAFANAAGPLFITGVTAVSLFRSPTAAPLLALAHYGSALLVGALLARLPSACQPAAAARRHEGDLRTRRSFALRSGWQALRAAAETAPPLGQLLAGVVRTAGQTVLLIGGFVVFFSVLLGLAEESGLTWLLARPVEAVARWAGLPVGLATAGLGGVLEVTNGLHRLAAVSGPLPARLTLASAMLAWSGLSVHAQAVAVSAPAGLSYGRFLQGRLLHAVLSPALLWTLWPLAPVLVPATPVLGGPGEAANAPASFGWTAAAFGLWLALLLAASLAATVIRWSGERVCLVWVPRSRRF